MAHLRRTPKTLIGSFLRNFSPTFADIKYSGRDGSLEFSMTVDPTGTGTNMVAGTITQNGEKRPKAAGTKSTISFQLPAGMQCTGGQSGNLCLASFKSAGGFGNCVALMQSGANVANASTAGAVNPATATGAAVAGSTSVAGTGANAAAANVNAVDGTTLSAADLATGNAAASTGNVVSASAQSISNGQGSTQVVSVNNNGKGVTAVQSGPGALAAAQRGSRAGVVSSKAVGTRAARAFRRAQAQVEVEPVTEWDGDDDTTEDSEEA
ncbi:hypothetical protein HGRIS_006478 [Hohenbuehelia grisea]|uniref:Uncharacterized protein n=1 Tax=Hohenbuehelia grisea TaxID=104357 RepID=A0ABR3K2J0_9AGAR